MRVDGQPVRVGQIARIGHACWGRTAALDAVLLTFDGSAVVQPAVVEHRNRRVSLDDAALDAVEQRVDERSEWGEQRLGVRVLRLQVRTDRRVITLAQPVPRVLDDRAIGTGQRVRSLRRDRGCGEVRIRVGQRHRSSGFGRIDAARSVQRVGQFVSGEATRPSDDRCGAPAARRVAARSGSRPGSRPASVDRRPARAASR